MKILKIASLLFAFNSYLLGTTITKHELGPFVGISNYLGDINPTRLFYAPSPAFGAIYKLNFNPREALRVHLNYMQIRGSDADFPNEFQKQRGSSFYASTLDLGTTYEFNFLIFKFKQREPVVSSFVYGGLGVNFPINSNIGMHFVVPFGAGIKYFFTKKVNVGFEHSFRKTFSDNIDGVSNPGLAKDNSLLSNKDWYTFTGFFITFRLFDRSDECAAFEKN